jgi:hypothetical protein
MQLWCSQRDLDQLRHRSDTLPKRQYVADVLERETAPTIARWLARVEEEGDIIAIPLTPEVRCAHLPALFRDLVTRLREPLALGTRAHISDAAHDHGFLRRVQGYTPAMLVEESRMLQVSIFQTLQLNFRDVDSNVLLLDVMAIADEVDSQLAQAMSSYVFEANADHMYIEA